MSNSEPSTTVAEGKPSPGLDADGRERPRFIATFPDDPALNALVQAFERGDFGYVRSNAGKVIESSTSSEVKAAAAELRRRIDPDPSVALLLGLAAAVFLFLVFWVYVVR